ncbi:UbiA family prenyltransferase [Cytophaga aurantiaca]|uniref:UbiA family prenyltransferase n=1 Tax=Cytophaga aurantiaca TaxID=29530 RepID=UPI0012FB8706|nr:UbiA family prenyltransferase [Cytophaga aurantiaca]
MMALIDKNTLKLLRIPFSLFLMPLFLLALSQSGAELFSFNTLVSFCIMHLLVYPSSNGYNSYIDKDEESIGGLEKPPLPTKKLYYVTLVIDILAITLGFIFINSVFAICILIYTLASRAYSSREIRLKKYPYIGFLVVFIFQGGFTYYMCYAGITDHGLELNGPVLYLLLGSSFQIAGAYPLTQIYQHQQDLKDGVVTISYKLGYAGTFIFTGLMFAITNVLYFLYFNANDQVNQFYIIQIFFVPIVMYYFYWFIKVVKNQNEANFKHTMFMNIIASTCMNSCFLVLYVINN